MCRRVASTSTSPVRNFRIRLLPPHHAPFDRHHKFRAQLFGLGVRFGMQLLVENDLRDSRAVAQVDEDQLAQVAPPVDPAHQHDVFVRVRRRAARRSIVSASNFRVYQASVCLLYSMRADPLIACTVHQRCSPSFLAITSLYI